MDIVKKITEYIQDNQLDEAMKLVRENDRKMADNAEFLNAKAVLLIMVGEHAAAVDSLKTALELDQNNIDAYYNLAYAYECLGNKNDAAAMYRRVLKMTEDIEFINQVVGDINRLEGYQGKIDTDRAITGQEYSDVIVIDTDNKTAPQSGDNIYSARSNVAKAMLDNDAPLVSIYVLAYNNLEKYTKTCVECILKYTTDVDYELILVDNGSTDGTFEYFKSVYYLRKKIIKVTKNIGANYGGNAGLNFSKGRYIVGIANDVYVTKNWLSNMLKCITSDDRIGMVNPVADYVSNLQSVNLGHIDFEDMQLKAAQFNISDPRKWEERIRLITLGTLYRKECLDAIGLPDYGFFHDFVDDDIAFRVRRAGYKAILCKDVFVCHAGKITDKGANIAKQSLEKGKRTFRDKYYGIDAWDDVNNFELTMTSLIETSEKNMCKKPRILGIDILCGTPLLELKNRLRNGGIFETELSAFSCDAKYWLDLNTICDGKVKVDRIEYILEHFEYEHFEYILLRKPLNLYTQPYKLLDDILKLLKIDGHLLVKIRNSYDARVLLNILGRSENTDCELMSHIDLNGLCKHLNSKGYGLKKVMPEFYQVDKTTSEHIRRIVKESYLSENTDDTFNKILVREYALDIKRSDI